MFDRFKRRSYELEYIDVGDYTPAEYEGCIVELQRVNRWLGDAHTLKRTFFKHLILQATPEFSVLDVGAGSGELLRVTVRWSRESSRCCHAVGLELNERSAKAIREESSSCPEIKAV